MAGVVLDYSSPHDPLTSVACRCLHPVPSSSPQRLLGRSTTSHASLPDTCPPSMVHTEHSTRSSGTSNPPAHSPAWCTPSLRLSFREACPRDCVPCRSRSDPVLCPPSEMSVPESCQHPQERTLLAALVSGRLGCGWGEPTASQSSLPPALMPCGVGRRRAVGMGVGPEAPTLPALGLRTREGWRVLDMAECSPAPAFFLGT